MATMALFGLVTLYCLSLLQGLIALREVRSLRRLRGFVRAAAFFALASVFLAGYLFEGTYGSVAGSDRTVTPLVAFALALSVVGAGTWLSLETNWRRSRRARRAAGEKTAGSTRKQSIQARIKFLRSLSGPHWERLTGAKYSQEDANSVSKGAKAISWAITGITIPLITLIIGTSIIVNVRGSAASDFAAQTLGYFTLLIATSWTVVYLLTIALIGAQQAWRGHGGQLSVMNTVVTVGTWAGLGAAGGVFVGALIPIVVVGLPKGLLIPLDNALLGVISPQLLLNISASGAVAGFLIGLVVSLIDFATGEDNLLVSTTFPPLVFGVLITVLGWLGLRPGAISRKLSTDYMTGTMSGASTGTYPFITPEALDLTSTEGFASLVLGFDSHGWNEFVDHRVYYSLTWLVVLLVVLFGFSIRMNKREQQLITLDKTADPSAPVTPRSGHANCPPDSASAGAS